MEFEELEKVKLLCSQKKSRHLFHNDCIYQWFTKRKTCPVCINDFDKQIKEFKSKTEEELVEMEKEQMMDFTEAQKRLEAKKAEHLKQLEGYEAGVIFSQIAQP